MIRKSTASALLFASFLTTAALAEEPSRESSALPRVVAVSASIEFDDLDLQSPAGIAEFQRRAARTAREMCRPDAVPAGPGRGRVDGHCYRQAMASARAQIQATVAARSGNVQTALNGSARTAVAD